MLLVVRTHQAVVYEIPTAAAPENAMARSKKLRVSRGLQTLCIRIRDKWHNALYSQITSETFRAPILYNDGKYSEDWDRQQIVVKHRIPVREPSDFDPLAHRKHLSWVDINSISLAIQNSAHIGGTRHTVHEHPEIPNVQVMHDACHCSERA